MDLIFVNNILKKLANAAVFKKIWILLAVLIILAAVCSSVFRSLTPWAKQYKHEVEQRLSLILAQPVKIQSMETGWYWFQPVIKLNQVTIGSTSKTPIHVNKLFVGINIFHSILRWRIEPKMLYLDKLHLVLREKAGSWTIDGLSSNAQFNQSMNLEAKGAVLNWLAKQDSLILQHISLDFHKADGRVLAVHGLNLSIVDNGGYYKLKGQASFLQKTTSLFQFSGRLFFDANQLEKTSGQLYVSAKNIVPTEWQAFMPKSSQLFEGGQGDLRLWLDLKNGRISSMQAELSFNQLAWHYEHKSQKLRFLDANLVWKPNTQGWLLQGDKIHLKIGHVSWPQNKFSLQFDKEKQSYQLFVKTIIVESLLAVGIEWPQYIQKIQKMKPHGLLTETRVLVKDNQPEFILTRFDNLGWRSDDKSTRVDNLTGVLNWQANEGRLELDSKQTVLQSKGFPTQRLNLLNGAFEWKALNDGLRVSVERFVFNQPELTLSGEGVVSSVTKNSIGHVRMNAQFSGKHIEQWIPYIPSKYLRPKLALWLKQDLKRIAKASGKITIDGLASDFPFDNKNGEFSILAHALGGKLNINPEWPLITGVEGYIRVKNRDLNIDLVHANFHGVPVNQMGIKIEDIGHNQEHLLIHGLVEADAGKIQDFVMHSPLKKKLWIFSMMSLKELIALNLNLDLPLYQEKSDIQLKGEIQFRNNTVLMNAQLGGLVLEELTGPLSFDETGIIQSSLTANVMGYPFNINIQSQTKPRHMTRVFFEGECTVESLKKQFDLDFFKLLKGKFFIQSELRLTDGLKDSNILEINSNLQGLAVHLPSPLGKSYNDKVPLKIQLDFNPKKDIRLRADYAHRVSTDILFQENNGSFSLYGGQIRLGGERAIDQNKAGIDIVGKLDDFDLKAWALQWSLQTADGHQTNWLSYLRIINVSLKELTLFKQSFNDLNLSAKILKDKSWSLTIKQKNISGDVVYQPATNALSGFLNHLHIEPFETGKEFTQTWKPKQIPNLNLRVDNLSFGEKEIGNLTIKSHSTVEKWFIDYCQIESPFYEMNVSGEWQNKEKLNKTNLELRLNIQDLSKSLERWHIIPAVDAKKAEMAFKGGWNNSIFNFSLAALKGDMSLKLKNGVITHLSPETEEKLGLGKLLSILSLQTIPRRLKLDFSDLSQKGFTFDIFQGNFTIDKGIMTTSDSYLDGPVAYAGMRGNLDLVNHLYDLDLKISPHITASLPIVATIAGGPIAGVAAWIANKMISQGMQKISGYSYKISGPWSQPVVQQLNIMRGN